MYQLLTYGLKLVEYVSTTHVWFETSRVSTTHVWFETSRVRINYSRMV